MPVHRARLLPPAGLAAALIALQLTAAPPAAAAELGTVYNQPDGSVAEQQVIRTRLLSLIATAAPGSRIKVSVYHFWDADVARALAAAHNDRDVDVQVIIDESSVSSMPSSTSYSILASALGTDRTQPSFAKLCAANGSCLGDPDLRPSIMHNKFWLFSDTGGSKNVVVQTSTNLSSGSWNAFYNDAVILSDAGLHTAYSSYFTRMAAQSASTWRYTTGTSASGPYKYYFFPRAGTDNSTDTVLNVLNNTTCTWSDSAGSHRTQIRVGMFKLTRQGVADKLADLKRKGCTVDIVYSSMDSASSTGTRGTWEALHFSGGPSVRCMAWDHDGDASTSPRVMHSKFLLINGRYAGATDKVMWTGSHNYTGPALRENDEAMLKINSNAIHDAYVARFNAVKAVARPGTADNVPACNGSSTVREL